MTVVITIFLRDDQVILSISCRTAPMKEKAFIIPSLNFVPFPLYPNINHIFAGAEGPETLTVGFGDWNSIKLRNRCIYPLDFATTIVAKKQYLCNISVVFSNSLPI